MRPAGRRFGMAGVLAALTCTLACCLPAILVALGAGASAAGGVGHAAHGGAQSQGWFAAVLDVLHRISPGLLLASIVLVAVAFAMRRRAAILPALVAGVVLYLSVHGQTDPAVMYAGMALGYGAWIALYLWTRPRPGAGSCEKSVL
ncbi:hypothetical protein [Mycolicibacter longobardus]|uniref:hypothetical protein n=1 Tax=Mycolicibacter longobardus TaxID=1108812 RepID=UPI001F48CC06|nr:hypothetical protein [Mycolicibacter longobardus]